MYVFRGIDENEKSRFNYLHSIDLWKNRYTLEKFEQNKELFGVYVLQSNSGMHAEQIFGGTRNAGELRLLPILEEQKGLYWSDVSRLLE